MTNSVRTRVPRSTPRRRGAPAVSVIFGLWFSVFGFLSENVTNASPSHPTDTPLSPTLVSPAQLYRFDAPSLSLASAYTKESEEQTWDSHRLSAASTASLTTLRLVRKASPSFYWSAVLGRRGEYDTAENSLAAGDETLHASRFTTTFGPEAAYKILDRLVVGAGVFIRRAEIDPNGPSPWSSNLGLLTQGVLLKSEWYEAGWAQTLLLYDEHSRGIHRTYRETLLHARYHVSEAFAFGLIVRRNPLPPCCTAAATSRGEYAGTGAWQAGNATTEVVYTYAPAYRHNDDYDIARHALAAQVTYAFTPSWQAFARLSAGYGHEQRADVRIREALASTDTASVTARSQGFAAGMTHPL